MKVKLISCTPNMLDVVYTGARTCYNAGSPIDMWFDVCNIPTDKKKKLLDKVLSSGHQSCLEHCSVVFAVEGVSRALLAQLSRHRFVQLSVQSQRYVEIKENQKELYELYANSDYITDYKNSELGKILDKYFTENEFKNANGYYFALDNYLEAIQMGEKPEDARRFLPNAVKTNMVVSMNIRELSHLCSLRLCTRAQTEIRQLIKQMRDLVVEKEEWLNKYLQSQCELNGFCSESKCCGRKPNLNKTLENEFAKGYGQALTDIYNTQGTCETCTIQN